MSKLRAVCLAFIMVSSLVAMPALMSGSMGTAVAEEDDDDEYTTYTDFEDRDASEWHPESDVDFSDDSHFGSTSLRVDDTEADNVFWEEGPTTHSMGDSTISGTFKSYSDESTRFGLSDGGTSTALTSMTTVYLTIEHDDNQIELISRDDGDRFDESVVVNDDYVDQWVNFKLDFNDGDARAKVWEVGTDEPENWQTSIEATDVESSVYASPGTALDGERVLHFDRLGVGDLPTDEVAGQVVDQDGEPVEDATVVGSGVSDDILDVDFADYDSIDKAEEDYDDIQEELADIEDQINNPRPDNWQSGLDLNDEFDDADAEYIAVHERTQWDMDGRNIIGDHGVWRHTIDPDLDRPRLNVPVNEPVVLSMWDPADEGGWYLGQDVVDENLYGSTTSGTIIVEELSPTGETLDQKELETNDFVEVTAGRNLGTKTHEAATYSFSGGFYRAYPEGNEAASYVFVAGSPTSIGQSYVRDLKDEQGDLTQRAQDIKDLKEQDAGPFVQTTITDENGEFSINAPAGVNEMNLEAYKADGEQLATIEEPSLTDLHELENEGYDGAFYLPVDGDTTVEVPDEDVEIEMVRVDTLPQTDLGTLNEQLEAFAEGLLDSSLDLATRTDQLLSELTNDELEDRWNDRTEFLDNLDDVDWEDTEYVRDDFYDDDGELLPPGEVTENIGADSEEEVLEDIEDAIDDAEDRDPVIDTSPPGDGDSDDGGDDPVYSPSPSEDDDEDQPITIEDGELHLEYPVPADTDREDVVLDLHWADGTTETLGEEYWTVEDSGLFGSQDHIVVDGYPVHEDDPATLTTDLRIATDDGVIDDDISVRNPAFTGDLPNVNVNLNTMSPGPSEEVSVALRPEDFDNYGELEDVAVFDPDGNEVQADVGQAQRATFETEGAGVYHVRPEFTDATGELFAQSFRVEAGGTAQVMPATVRIESTPTDEFALAGDALTDASVTVNGDDTEIVATIPGSADSPGEIHVHPDGVMAGSENTLDLSVVRGADREPVNDNIGIVVHLESHTDDALHRTNENPITWDGDTRFGEVQDRGDVDSDKHVIRTYTDADGQATIEINEDPDQLDRLGHWWSVRMINLPIISIGFGELAGWLFGSGAGFAAVWLGRRRIAR